MPNIELAKTMLEDLARDFQKQWDTGRINVSLSDYVDKYGVSPEDMDAYMATLPLIEPKYSECPICGREWTSLERVAKPISNGHIIDFVDSFEMWCSGQYEWEEKDEPQQHGTLWYFQDKSGECSFNYELDEKAPCDFRYEVRWNCQCMEEACRGKCVLVDHGEDGENYTIISVFDPSLPFSITMEELGLMIACAEVGPDGLR